MGFAFTVKYWSSQSGKLPPELLTAPDVNLSAHPAPIVQSQAGVQIANVQIVWDAL
jgi:hypothetical protein